MPDRKTTKEIIDLTQKLISFKTTHDNKEELIACINFIKEYYFNSKVFISEFTFKGFPCLFIATNKRKRQDLILNGHIDVVPGNETQFHATVETGKLFGRGAYDMKTQVATMMVLLKNLSNNKILPKVGLMIVSDEEVGGPYCTRLMIKKGYKSHFALIGEPTNFHLETKHKGLLVVQLLAYGAHSHGARPWSGRNAIEKLWKQYTRFVNDIEIQATSKHKWHISVNPTSFIAEGPFNMTPSRAEMTLDIRTTEDFNMNKVIQILRKNKIKYKVLVKGSMLLNRGKNQIMKSLKKITEKELHKRVKYIKSCGSSDGRFFSEQNIPSINFGMAGKNHHKSTEYVKIGSIGSYYRILDKFVKENFSK